MQNVELLDLLVRQAKKYRSDAWKSVRLNKHMNDVSKDDQEPPQHVVDALLTDFINRVGMSMGVDYALYTKDLLDGRDDPVCQSQEPSSHT